jgi:uncharacterized protein
MIYFDTSFLAPLVLPEATSQRVTRFIRRLPVAELATSHWTMVEFASLLAREVRMGALAAVAAGRADTRFEELLAGTFSMVTLDAGDFMLARAFLQRHDTGLRAGDALHLAVASNRSARAVYSLDKKMVTAAARLGLKASLGIRP